MSQSIARAHLLRFLRSRGIDAIAVVVGIATFRRHSMEILEFNSCMNHTIREIVQSISIVLYQFLSLTLPLPEITMPGNHLISSRLPSALIVHSSRSSILPTQSIAATYAPRGARLQSLTKEWKGAHTEEHSIPRAKRGDTKDPSADAVASGMEERDVNEGIADDTKSQATTQRGGLKEERKAKKEHPAAPEPIIGMNDERGGV